MPEPTPAPLPALGDQIYVRSSYYIDHGEDDVQGGRATVAEVTYNPIQKVHFVGVSEHPGHSYNWEGYLGRQQTELARRYGEDLAREDPDYGEVRTL